MNGMLLSEIINRSILACYCILVIYLVRLFLKKISRKYCYYLWFVVFFNLCIPFSFVSSFSLIPQRVMEFSVENSVTPIVDNPEEEIEKSFMEGNEPENIIIFSGNGVTTPYKEELTEVFDEMDVSTRQNNKNEQRKDSTELRNFGGNVWLIWGERIWILGIAILGGYSLYITFCFRQNMKQGKIEVIDTKERIVMSHCLNAPVLSGIMFPTIYLPKDLEEEEAGYIIAHEKYHRKRKDYLVKPILYIITIVYWFHPLVWFAYHLCCEDMEISCDEAVLKNAGSNIRKEYAHSLLKYAAKQNGFLLSPLTFGEPSLRSRIEYVLKYKKKSVFVTITALVVTVVMGIGLIFRPVSDADSKSDAVKNGKSDNRSNSEVETISGKEPDFTYSTEEEKERFILNNGGELIQVDENIYYMSGSPLYAYGDWFYVTGTDEEGIDYITRHKLDGSAYSLLMQGTIVGISNAGDSLYYMRQNTGGENSFWIYHMESETTHQIYEGEYNYLAMDGNWVYYYEKTDDGLYIHRSRTIVGSENGDKEENETESGAEVHGEELERLETEENLLDMPLKAEEISCFDVTDTHFLFAAGVHEGSAGYFYGDFYSYNLETKELVQKHMTDDDKFIVFDEKIYYSKYSNEGFGENALYCASFDFNDENIVGESMKFLEGIEEKEIFLASSEGKLFTVSKDGKEKTCIFDLAEHNWQIEELDKINFKEVNVLGDMVFTKIEQWGYRGEDGWRDTLIDSRWYRISLTKNQSQVWTPDDIVEKGQEEEIGFLWNPIPGQPCENPREAGWNMEHIVDVREKFSRMSYTPEEGTEDDTYLLGKTKSYTLYGKGDYRYLLLECDGNYAQIRYDYTSNYMTPLDLMEIDLDKDGKQELAIKFNVKHGTGVSIDTFLLADFGKDNNLYVNQYLDADFTADLGTALSFEKKENGIQAMVNEKNAGYFMENMEDVGVFNMTTIGSQIHFYYDLIENEIQLSGDIMFMTEDSVSYWINWNDVTATVNWDGEKFFLSDFTSRNREMEQRIIYALEDFYGVESLYDVNVSYDSFHMNQENIVVTAEILKTESDRVYDRKEISLKRVPNNVGTYGGWEINGIL